MTSSTKETRHIAALLVRRAAAIAENALSERSAATAARLVTEAGDKLKQAAELLLPRS